MYFLFQNSRIFSEYQLELPLYTKHHASLAAKQWIEIVYRFHSWHEKYFSMFYQKVKLSKRFL